MPGGARGVEPPVAAGGQSRKLLVLVFIFCLGIRCCCSEERTHGTRPSSAPGGHKQSEETQIPRHLPALNNHAQKLLDLLENRFKHIKSNPSDPLIDYNVDNVRNKPQDHAGDGEIITSDIIEGRPSAKVVNSDQNYDILRQNQLDKENVKLDNTLRLNSHKYIDNIEKDVSSDRLRSSESVKVLENTVKSELKHQSVDIAKQHNQETGELKQSEQDISENAVTDRGNRLPVLSDGPDEVKITQTDLHELENKTSNEDESDEGHLVEHEIVIVSESGSHVKLRAPYEHDAPAYVVAADPSPTTVTTDSSQPPTTQPQQITDSYKPATQTSDPQQTDEQKLASQGDDLASTIAHKYNNEHGEKRKDGENGGRKSDDDQKEKTEKIVNDALQKHTGKNDEKRKVMVENNSIKGDVGQEIKQNKNEIVDVMNSEEKKENLDKKEENKKEYKIEDTKNNHDVEHLKDDKDMKKDLKDQKDDDKPENINTITEKKNEEPNMTDKQTGSEKVEQIELNRNEGVEKNQKESVIPKEKDLVTKNDQNIVVKEKDGKIELEKDTEIGKDKQGNIIEIKELETSEESEKRKEKTEKEEKQQTVEKDDSKEVVKEAESVKQQDQNLNKEDESEKKEGIEIKTEDKGKKMEQEEKKMEHEEKEEEHEEKIIKDSEKKTEENKSEEVEIGDAEDKPEGDKEKIEEGTKIVVTEEKPVVEAPDMETYIQFQERVSAAKEKKTENGHTVNGHGAKGSKFKSKNYASTDCGAKMITANPEAQHASKVIATNKDEYLLNKCEDKTWFIVELCESIQPQRFEVANFELFSNLPKDIIVYGSHRFPTREWTTLGKFIGLEGTRTIQSFNINSDGFFKYIKVDVLSNYGSEFYCPFSLFKIYGISEFEVIEDTGETEEIEDTFDPTEEEKTKKKEEGKPSGFPDVLKTMLNNVMDVIKRGYRPAVGVGEPVDACQNLSPSYALKAESCLIADHVNYIMQCYAAEYQDIMQRPAVAAAVTNTSFCQQLVSVMCSTPHVNDSLVYDTACNNSYICVMLSPKHVLAMCFMQDPALLTNTGHPSAKLGCSDSTSDNISLKTIPPLEPSDGGQTVREGGAPINVNNNLINTSTVTRTDSSDSLKNRSGVGTGPVTALPVDITEQVVNLPREEVELEEKKESEPKESGNKDAAIVSASSQEKKSKKKQEKQQKEEKKEQDDIEKTNGDKQHVNAQASVNVGVDEKENVQISEEILATTPSPVETSLPETKIPQTPTNKESVMVRLSNKIKVLESNVTISSAYLEELSRHYKRQMEDMYKAFNTTATVAYERDLQHQKDISELKEHLENLSGIVTELQSDRASLANTVVEQHLLLMLLEVLVLTVVFTWCNRRRRVSDTNAVNSGNASTGQRTEEGTNRTEEDSNWPPQYYKAGHHRRNSLDSVMGEREVRPRRQRRHSEEALNITGTYSDLLIIEPAIPIMMDSYPERKKKRKSGILNLKRSKSNSNIRRADKCSPNARQVTNKSERVSSAGVLFVGDQQVSGSGDVTQMPLQTNESLNHTQNDVSLNTSLDDSNLHQDYTQRSFVDEIDSGVGLPGHSVGGINDPIECCANCDALSNSRAVSLTKSLSLNGLGKAKKVKKVKRSKSVNKNDNCKDTVYNEHNYASKNGSVSFGYETTLPFGGYCYDSRDLNDYPHYTDAAHMNGHNSYDYYNGYYSDPRTEADRLVTWVSSSSGYDPLLPSLNGQRGYDDFSPKTKLRSDNWEWYAGMVPSTESTEHVVGDTGRGVPVSSDNHGSETVIEAVSTSSDSSGKNQRGKSPKVRSGKKKKSKGHKNPNVVEEEVGEEIT